jgi:predicted aldo/keto reductase-like oxidoreductase
MDKRGGNKLSALGFGCMRLPGGMGRIDREKTEQLLLKAYESGVNYYDTAYLYPGSEEALGEILEKHGLREKVFIATKLPQAMCREKADFDRFFGIQKQRLRTGYFDYYLMHNITDFVQWEKLCALGIKEWISLKKKSGEIKQIGFSFHGPHADFIKTLDAYDWDFVQIQYNYINTHYQAGTEGLRYAAGKGVSVFIMEPLLGGKLAKLPKEAETILQKAKSGSTPAEWALRFVWNESGVTLLLSGMNQMSQLEENTAICGNALPGSFTESDQKTIDDIKTVFNKSYRIPCTGCNYCMPCPKKINIPACFESYNTSFALGLGAGLYNYMVSVGFLGSIPHYASDCAQCGACESKCPQNIKIQKQLKTLRRRLELPGMKLVRPLVRKMMAK